MKRIALYIFLTVLNLISAHGTPLKSIESPNGNIKLSFHLDENGVPCYSVDWSKSIYLDAEPGEYIIAARKDKHSNNWFIGGVTNVNPAGKIFPTTTTCNTDPCDNIF